MPCRGRLRSSPVNEPIPIYNAPSKEPAVTNLE